jgi:hypothetical protein
MTVLEMRMNGAGQQTVSPNPIDQSSHAAAPEAHNDGVNGKHIVLFIAFLMLAIYGLKILGRVIKRVE